jgi:hypothetical protein
VIRDTAAILLKHASSPQRVSTEDVGSEPASAEVIPAVHTPYHYD